MRAFLLLLTVPALAPKGMSSWELLNASERLHVTPEARGGTGARVAAATVLAVACGLGAAAVTQAGWAPPVVRAQVAPVRARASKGGRVPLSEPASSSRGGAGGSFDGAAAAAGSRAQPQPCNSEDEGSASPSSVDPDTDEADGEDAFELDDEEPQMGARPRAANATGAGKLWSKSQFPEGCTPIQACWDMENLRAAQAWTCPCADRVNCIGEDRLKTLELYDYRKKFQTTCANGGGKRDATRKEMEQHADAAGNISRSFVVGPLNDCCVASAGLAKGISFGSFATARADMRKQRPMRIGRKRKQ